MNNITFRTGGDWDSTSLYNNGLEVPAAQLFVELRAGRDEYGEVTGDGIWDGADLTALVRPAQDPDSPFDILPGRVEMQFPGHTVVVENAHPLVELSNTRVYYNGEEITNRVVDVYVDINAQDNVVQAFVSVYKTRWFRSDELITYTIVG